MQRLLSTFLASASLASLLACTPAQVAQFKAIEVQAKNDIQVFCKTRDQVLPFIQAGESFLSMVYPPAEGLVLLDQTTVDPILNSGCKAAGGVLVAPPK